MCHEVIHLYINGLDYPEKPQKERIRRSLHTSNLHGNVQEKFTHGVIAHIIQTVLENNFCCCSTW